MTNTNTNPRPKAAPSVNPELTVTAEDLVVQELSRYGSRTAAELLASVQAAPHAIIASTTALFVRGTVTFTEDRRRFVLRGDR
jgi:hypothetical protein